MQILIMSKKSKKISVPLLAISMVVVFGVIVTLMRSFYPNKRNSVETESEYKIEILSKSPSGKYIVQKDNKGKVYIVSDSKQKSLMIYDENFNSSNIAWSNNGEILIVTNVAPSKPEDRSAFIDFYESSSANLISNVNIGTGGFYGINEDRAFPPKVSPDQRYVAVQNDLIHAISIFDMKGNLVVKAPTVFKSTELFSPEMYELDGGTYSPFLSYEWAANSKSINYKFLEGRTTYSLDLSRYVAK